jgi:hypothetical protein
LRCVILVALLTGCSTFIAKPYEERITDSTVVTWTTVDDVEKECIKAGAKDPGAFQNILACAIYNKNSCKIMTAKTTSMETLGHELRHCFEGKFHK